ncbi:glycosyltransferase [Sporichthya polymorpha]|uniref:glycosyltransferase n=1 Tax=Sporichthya polymorpha TaxID=35751 RepID=UPI0003A2F729|nr:glycosyltransferase [Sporichthya polymorpha]
MTRRAMVYGHVDLNLIDGSAIWVQGIVQTLSNAGCQVDLVLKAPIKTDRLTAPLAALPNVTLVKPFEDALLPELANGKSNGLTPPQVSQVLKALDTKAPYDLVVVRGLPAVSRLVADDVATGRLWTYLTDVPQSVVEATPEAVSQLTAIAKASRFLLCQTEELRGFFEGLVPEACGRSVLFPPVAPEVTGVESPPPPSADSTLKLVYTGKYAPRWNTLEMAALPEQLAARGVNAELHMVGDKVHDDPKDPTYKERMQSALESGKGVVWHGGQPREKAMQLAGAAHVGLSWRDADLDDSLELSTKVLEYGVLGLPAVLNRTPMHERLLGPDYPLFVDGIGADGPDHGLAEVVGLIAGVATDPARYALARERTGAAAAQHTMTKATERMSTLLERAFPSARPNLPAAGARPLRVVVAGHDMKFFTRIADYLAALPGVELRMDNWETLGRHDKERSRELLDWADVIICEWCGGNAIWYSKHKRSNQRLIIRLHRFELFTNYVKQVKIRNVDTVVCVNRHYADLTAQITRWPTEKIVVVPNWVDGAQLDRPKLTGAQFHLGMIGIAPARKRMDLALDVLSELRRDDKRFHLFVKSKQAWDYWWVWKQPAERAHVDDLMRRIRTDPNLRDAVVFDGFGPDVPAWLRGIGWVLSTSDDESFHLSPAEGMASGAVPAVLPWPGARTVYAEEWVHDSAAAIAAEIRTVTAEGTWEDRRAEAQRQVTAAFDLPVVCGTFADLLTGAPKS